MECTVIVVTHGNLANELIETSRMLVGSYENVITLDFMPGENVESLIKKIYGVTALLPETMPILFVVDMFSGSPFNASSYFVKKRPGSRIIAGVNIPMLVNILLERPEAESLDELVEMAVSIGKDAVKPL